MLKENFRIVDFEKFKIEIINVNETKGKCEISKRNDGFVLKSNDLSGGNSSGKQAYPYNILQSM
jgi:hypothetical protein